MTSTSTKIINNSVFIETFYNYLIRQQESSSHLCEDPTRCCANSFLIMLCFADAYSAVQLVRIKIINILIKALKNRYVENREMW